MTGIRGLSAGLYLLLTIPVALYLLLDRRQAVETAGFHMDPAVVSPGGMFQAVWTDTPLRRGCTGAVYRRFTGIKDGVETSWVQPAVHVVFHGAVGDPEVFRTSWRVPNMDPGTKGVFKKHIKRWCNVFQEWLWPMEEDQEAEFTVK